MVMQRRAGRLRPAHTPEHRQAPQRPGKRPLLHRGLEILPERQERHVLEGLLLDGAGDRLLRRVVRRREPVVAQRLQLRRVRPAEPAVLPLPRMPELVAGLAMSMPVKVEKNTLQPPLSGAALLARRCTIVPQSVVCWSTFMPHLRSMSAPTLPSAPRVGKSDGDHDDDPLALVAGSRQVALHPVVIARGGQAPPCPHRSPAACRREVAEVGAIGGGVVARRRRPCSRPGRQPRAARAGSPGC